MKTIGRIILIVVGALLLIFSIPLIINAVNALNASGWTDLTAYPDKMQQLMIIIAQGVNALFGLVALIAALRGKRSFLLLLSAILLLITPVSSLIYGIQNNTLNDAHSILVYIEEFGLPIAYFVGLLLV